METTDRLEKVDMIRERTGLSYSAADALLEQADGDVLQALIMFEQGERMAKGAQWGEFEAKGHDIIAKIKALIQQGNVTKVIVKKDARTIAEIPVTAGVIGALLAPQLAVLGSAACLLGQCRIVVERAGEPATEIAVDHHGGQEH
ncbi:MAG TPA: DUF4342 domain-containing protein [Firmicutes bacterium]|jgi:hypothetical protein|nr:DUF4342 domain-containing protein [Bacillota bacterium]